jgi:hypothetical protein
MRRGYGVARLEVSISSTMPSIGRTPESDSALVRTDYSDQAAWSSLISAVRAETDDGFRAFLDVIEDRDFDGLDAAAVRASVTEEYEDSFLIVADHAAMAEPDHALLVIDLLDEPGRSFRAIPAAIQAIQNHLSIANMDFSDFADSVDADGVFRSFPDGP